MYKKNDFVAFFFFSSKNYYVIFLSITNFYKILVKTKVLLMYLGSLFKHI